MWHAGDVSQSDSFPDFKIPHAEKIEWMIETSGWALEPVAPKYDSDPPCGAYAYTIGLPASHRFPDIVVFGLTPVATKGIVELVVEQLAHGVEVPLDTVLVGLLHNDLRCVFAEVDTQAHVDLFETAAKWYRGRPFEMVQLVWPDLDGWLPTESGFDASLRFAQPIIASRSWENT